MTAPALEHLSSLGQLKRALEDAVGQDPCGCPWETALAVTAKHALTVIENLVLDIEMWHGRQPSDPNTPSRVGLFRDVLREYRAAVDGYGR